MSKKIILSLSVISIVAAIVVGGTIAYFSDEETSAGNTFTAGAIDLTIDNESYALDYNIPEYGDPSGEFVLSDNNTWQLSDLTDQLFFHFIDLKPGDIGEDTISLHVNNNDAYACMAIDITDIPENDLVDPEVKAGDESAEEGELQNYLQFAFWADDGDNVYEMEEEVFWLGTAVDLFDGTWQTLADSEKNVWDPQGGSLPGGEERYIAKAWCFGELEPTPVEYCEEEGDPTTCGTGFVCNVDGDYNDAQTDGIEADVMFYAVQSRHNEDFVCSVCEIEGELGEDWSETAYDHAFALGAKFGDSDVDRGDPEWYGPELFVQESVSAGNSVIADENHEWTKEQWYDFTVDYDGNQTASITVDGQTAGITDPGIENPTGGEISITVKTVNDPWNDIGDKVAVRSLKLNDCLINPDNIEAVHSETGRILKHIQLSGLDISGGFTLTGEIMFDWQTTATRFYREAFGMNIDVK